MFGWEGMGGWVQLIGLEVWVFGGLWVGLVFAQLGSIFRSKDSLLSLEIVRLYASSCGFSRGSNRSSVGEL